MPIEQQPPVVLAMLLADTVLLDAATGKNTIQGPIIRWPRRRFR
jgi:hypothetical protein